MGHDPESNARAFTSWIADRDLENDWARFLTTGNLNKSEIAKICGFSRSVFAQNPVVKSLLTELESRLSASGLRGKTTEAAARGPGVGEVLQNVPEAKTDEKVRQLEQQIRKRDERIAVLLAENSELRSKVTRLRHVEETLETGKRVLP